MLYLGYRLIGFYRRSSQPIERPGDYEQQKKYYLGKKANYTKKSQVTVLPKGKDIVDMVVGKPGLTRNQKIFDERQPEFAPHRHSEFPCTHAPYQPPQNPIP